MEIKIGSRFKNAFNAFRNINPTNSYNYEYSNGSYYRPDRIALKRGNERSIITAAFNRIAIDAAAIRINHCEIDDNGRFVKNLDTNLNNCLSLETNKDQTSRAFIQDVVMSMFDEGVVAIVPVDTVINTENNNRMDICSMRVGKIVAWYPDHVRLELYNDKKGVREEIFMPKNMVAIIENPLYAIMNEPNSTLKRLIRKLNLLDAIDEQSGSGKLDLIIQLPYIVKSQTRKDQANQRRDEIESQLRGSKYGIAYTDGTEKITQLNRPVENNLLAQIEYLTTMLFSQLGVTQTVLDGTADDKTMLNYYSRTIEPIMASIVDSMRIKFLSKDNKTQHETIAFFRDPFKLVPVNDLAEIADKFTRNEILTSNEIRQIVGIKPSNDPKADKLMNSNINQSNQTISNIYGDNNIPDEGLDDIDEEGVNENG